MGTFWLRPLLHKLEDHLSNLWTKYGVTLVPHPTLPIPVSRSCASAGSSRLAVTLVICSPLFVLSINSTGLTSLTYCTFNLTKPHMKVRL